MKTTEKQAELETCSSTSRQNQQPKRRPGWYGQNVMISKIEERVGEAQNSESQTEKQIRQGLKAILNFEAMTQKEIDECVNN